MQGDKIHILPSSLSDQIAAGEVLERASSAVKELIENALDAGATVIEIELEDAGKKRLAVIDNGQGMSRADAQLAVVRHATSKIATPQDLARIATMGFRGEALASMAAVSKLTITTQRRQDQTGTHLRIEGAQRTECRETATSPGTQIVVEDLFYNTPVRLKFLKTNATEQRRVLEVVEQFAIACPEVHFKLTFDGKIKCDYPAHSSLKARALAVLGHDVQEHFFPIVHTHLGDVLVEGLFCAPGYAQSNSGRLYTYVNRRIVRDKTIQAAISQAYREFLQGKMPWVILFATMPLEQVDVNVHPTKHEIRFQDADQVFRAIHRALRDSLQQTPWIRRVDMPRPSEYVQSPGEAASTLSATGFFESEGAFDSPERSMRAALGLKAFEAQHRAPAAGQDADTTHWQARYHESHPPSGAVADANAFSLAARAREAIGDIPKLPLESDQPLGYFSGLRYLGQLALTYLVCTDQNTLVIIDQHAAHERINYEKLKAIAENHAIASSQGLLFPILMPLDARLVEVLNEYMNFFESLGFQMDDLGNRSFAIRSVPEALVDYDYVGVIRAALVDLAEQGRATQFDELRDEVLAAMACHSSIRAGRKLTPEEVRILFQQMDEAGFRSNCPHGRPVHFTLTPAELEKRFLRN